MHLSACQFISTEMLQKCLVTDVPHLPVVSNWAAVQQGLRLTSNNAVLCIPSEFPITSHQLQQPLQAVLAISWAFELLPRSKILTGIAGSAPMTSQHGAAFLRVSGQLFNANAGRHQARGSNPHLLSTETPSPASGTLTTAAATAGSMVARPPTASHVHRSSAEPA